MVTRNSNPLRLCGKGVHWKVQEVFRWTEAGTVTRLPTAWVPAILHSSAQEVTVTLYSAQCLCFLLSRCRWASLPGSLTPPRHGSPRLSCHGPSRSRSQSVSGSPTPDSQEGETGSSQLGPGVQHGVTWKRWGGPSWDCKGEPPPREGE